MCVRERIELISKSLLLKPLCFKIKRAKGSEYLYHTTGKSFLHSERNMPDRNMSKFRKYSKLPQDL